jgi:hypothetical protein
MKVQWQVRVFNVKRNILLRLENIIFRASRVQETLFGESK